MKTISVRCQSCAAVLSVDEDCRFLTCSGCGAELELVRNGGALFTRAVSSEPGSTTRQSSGNELSELKRQNELLRLDHEWQVYRQKAMNHGRYGQYEPNAKPMIWVGVIMILFFGGLMASFPDVKMGPFPMLMGGMMFAMAVRESRRARDFKEQQSAYLEKRKLIEEKTEPPPAAIPDPPVKDPSSNLGPMQCGD